MILKELQNFYAVQYLDRAIKLNILTGSKTLLLTALALLMSFAVNYNNS